MRVWNFSAGPSMLPLEVLEQAAAEMTDWHGTGMSIMEMSHRSKDYMGVRDEAEADLRALLSVPDDFAVLFVQGGAQGQNGLLPLNLIQRNGSGKADYVLSGSWSVKSCEEAQRYGDIHVAGTSGQAWQDQGKEWAPWTWFPEPSQWDVRPDAAYLHVCTNETIGGVEFNDIPKLDVPVVADVSSNILSCPIDFSRVSVAYAGAQKNAGMSGIALMMIRKDLLGHAMDLCPSAFNYANIEKQQSMFNTPPTYSIYMAGLMFKWLERQGGVAAMQARNAAKSEALYGFLDASEFYTNTVHPAYRSRMNVPFLLRDQSLDALFLEQATAAGLTSLKGHKSVGGMRASIYNAMPLEGVQALIDFMTEFERRNG